MFTLGTMSHHSTYEGTDTGWGLTLTSAAIAAALARHYYFKAIVGVAGVLCNPGHVLYLSLRFLALHRLTSDSGLQQLMHKPFVT